jgi:methylglutaconyl-CoA hydratase
MTTTSTIDVAIDGPVATVSLNRPDVRNAMNPTMIGEIRDAMATLNASPEIRVIVIRGTGKAFCAGGDLNWMRDVLGQAEDEVVEDSRNLLDMYRAIHESPKLVIARLQGAAVAGALGIVACCDIAIAEAETKFCVSEVKIGLVPGIIAAFILPRIGPGWFGYFAKSGITFDAEAARASGFIQEVADGEAALDARVAAHVSLALSSSPDAIADTGKLIANLGYAIDEETFDTGLKYNAKARLSDAAQEGISSFLEKRNPAWKAG